MRRLCHDDVVALARYLHALPRALRAEVCNRAFDQDHAADLYRKRFGRMHLRFGDGSVAGWVGRQSPLTRREPWLSEPSYAATITLVLARFAARDQPDAQDTQRKVVRSSLSRPSGIGSPQSSQIP